LDQRSHRNGGDAVVDAEGGRAGVDHNPAPEVIAEPVPQTRQMPDVGPAHRFGHLGLKGEHASVGQVGDQIDLVVAARRAQVTEAPRPGHRQVQVGPKCLMVVGLSHSQVAGQPRLHRRGDLLSRRQRRPDTPHRLNALLGETLQRHRRDLTPPLRQRHGPQPQRQYPARSRMDVGGDGGAGRTTEDELPRRSVVVDRAPHRVPHLRNPLPLIDENRTRQRRPHGLGIVGHLLGRGRIRVRGGRDRD